MAACDCLTTEDSSLPHAQRCATMYNGNGDAADRDDIRELAEIAATTDIDTALYVLRSYRARTGK